MTSVPNGARDLAGNTLGVNGWRIHGRRTGVGRYLLNIVSRWREPGAFTGIVFYSPQPLKDLTFSACVKPVVLSSNWPMLVWENFRLAPRARDGEAFAGPKPRNEFSRRARLVQMANVHHPATHRGTAAPQNEQRPDTHLLIYPFTHSPHEHP